MVTLTSVSQYSVIKLIVVLRLGPPQGFGNTYCTTNVPTPVKVILLPTKTPGPLETERVPPEGEGIKSTLEPIQYFEVGPVGCTDKAISGVEAPQRFIGEVANVKTDSVPDVVTPFPILPLILWPT